LRGLKTAGIKLLGVGENNGIRKVYTIVSDYAPGIDAEVYFDKAFKAAGGDIIGSARTPQQETNFAAYMWKRSCRPRPDALFMRRRNCGRHAGRGAARQMGVHLPPAIRVKTRVAVSSPPARRRSPS
jgi:hypothetical protein